MAIKSIILKYSWTYSLRMTTENNSNDKISKEDIQAFANKLNYWAQDLPVEELTFLNILISDAKLNPKAPANCPDIHIVNDIQGIIVDALEATIGSNKVIEGGYKSWSRTSGMR